MSSNIHSPVFCVASLARGSSKPMSMRVARSVEAILDDL